MDTAALLELYDTTVRRTPDADPTTRVLCRDGLVLVCKRYVFVSWWDFQPDEADETIRTLINDIRASGQPVIWRIYEHDAAGDLGERLTAQGFIQQPSGRLMVYDLAHAPPPSRAADIRKVETADDYRIWSSVNNAGFGSNFPCDAAEIEMALADKAKPLFIAYENGAPVACACLWTPVEKSFCGLHGGAVLAEARGRGHYRDLTMHRLHLARTLGYRYAGVDANSNSGPRLERMGFRPIIGETTWTLDFDA